MSISKIKGKMQQTNLKGEKKGIRITLGGFVEVLILIFIPITSINLDFLTVPIFLSITFLLIQIRKVAISIIQKNKVLENDE